MKAHLVGRGCEDQEINTIQTDSPTCCKESLRLALVINVSNGCENSFSSNPNQGNHTKRDVYIKPPKEGQTNSIKIKQVCVWVK